MMWLRRIGFFILLNVVVITTLSLILQLFNVAPYLNANGLNYESLIVFCTIWGMGGAFISLLLSKVMARWMMGVKVIDPRDPDPTARRLVETVHALSRKAGLTTMPDVGIYESPEINAFATGPSRNNSLVAVSTGLMQRMSDSELQGVLGHEVSHIANGDMVTMTLIQGVVNAFVMALARVIAFAIDNVMRGDRDNRGGGLGYFGYMITVWVLELLLFIPGSFVIAWFSRFREFRADAGGARLAGRGQMIGALRRLQSLSEVNDQTSEQAPAFASLKISSQRSSGLMTMLRSTHPPLALRIERLERAGAAI